MCRKRPIIAIKACCCLTATRIVLPDKGLQILPATTHSDHDSRLKNAHQPLHVRLTKLCMEAKMRVKTQWWPPCEKNMLKLCTRKGCFLRKQLHANTTFTHNRMTSLCLPCVYGGSLKLSTSGLVNWLVLIQNAQTYHANIFLGLLTHVV